MDNSPNREAGPPSAEAWIGGVKFDLGNRYKLLSLLGRGTFGTVAAGCDVESGKKVAIKHVHPIADNLSGARHILREVATMKLLRNHPNIIRLEEVHVNASNNTLYIVMELMECDLRSILSSGQILSGARVKVFLKQLLLGVQAMHRHGIIHRGLKPANLLILSDCQLRVTDFGLARRATSTPAGENDGDREDDAILTGYVEARWYRAPEAMLEPEGGYAAPVDIWSIGCIFGEMLTCGEPLFPGKDHIDQVRLILATLGKPSTVVDDPLGFKLGRDALRFLQTVEVPEGRSLESIVPPDTGEDTLHLLKQMLQMNTMLRLTAAQALEHPFLNDCPVLQTTSSTKDASVDKPLTEVFDESAVDFSFEEEGLSLDELRTRIVAEAALYQDRRPEPLDEDGSAKLTPTLNLGDDLGVIRAQRRPAKDDDKEAGPGFDADDVAVPSKSGGLGRELGFAANSEGEKYGFADGLNRSIEGMGPSARGKSFSAPDPGCGYHASGKGEFESRRNSEDDSDRTGNLGVDVFDDTNAYRGDGNPSVCGEGVEKTHQRDPGGSSHGREKDVADEKRSDAALSDVAEKNAISLQKTRHEEEQIVGTVGQRDECVERGPIPMGKATSDKREEEIVPPDTQTSLEADLERTGLQHLQRPQSSRGSIGSIEGGDGEVPGEGRGRAPETSVKSTRDGSDSDEPDDQSAHSSTRSIGGKNGGGTGGDGDGARESLEHAAQDNGEFKGGVVHSTQCPRKSRAATACSTDDRHEEVAGEGEKKDGTHEGTEQVTQESPYPEEPCESSLQSPPRLPGSLPGSIKGGNEGGTKTSRDGARETPENPAQDPRENRPQTSRSSRSLTTDSTERTDGRLANERDIIICEHLEKAPQDGPDSKIQRNDSPQSSQSSQSSRSLQSSKMVGSLEERGEEGARMEEGEPCERSEQSAQEDPDSEGTGSEIASSSQRSQHLPRSRTNSPQEDDGEGGVTSYEALQQSLQEGTQLKLVDENESRGPISSGSSRSSRSPGSSRDSQSVQGSKTSPRSQSSTRVSAKGSTSVFARGSTTASARGSTRSSATDAIATREGERGVKGSGWTCEDSGRTPQEGATTDDVILPGGGGGHQTTNMLGGLEEGNSFTADQQAEQRLDSVTPAKPEELPVNVGQSRIRSQDRVNNSVDKMIIDICGKDGEQVSEVTGDTGVPSGSRTMQTEASERNPSESDKALGGEADPTKGADGSVRRASREASLDDQPVGRVGGHEMRNEDEACVNLGEDERRHGFECEVGVDSDSTKAIDASRTAGEIEHHRTSEDTFERSSPKQRENENGVGEVETTKQDAACGEVIKPEQERMAGTAATADRTDGLEQGSTAGDGGVDGQGETAQPEDVSVPGYRRHISDTLSIGSRVLTSADEPGTEETPANVANVGFGGEELSTGNSSREDAKKITDNTIEVPVSCGGRPPGERFRGEDRGPKEARLERTGEARVEQFDEARVEVSATTEACPSAFGRSRAAKASSSVGHNAASCEEEEASGNGRRAGSFKEAAQDGEGERVVKTTLTFVHNTHKVVVSCSFQSLPVEEKQVEPGIFPGGVSRENLAATRIQATCRRRAAYRAVFNIRNGREHSLVRGGAATSRQLMTPDQNREEQRAINQRNALGVRRPRALNRESESGQHLFSGRGSRQRGPLKEDRRQLSKDQAATKIQVFVRRWAAFRRTASRRGKKSSEDSAIDTRKTSEARGGPKKGVPTLAIASSSETTQRGMRRTASTKAPREPLAVLRRLRDHPESTTKTKTDQFHLRTTIRSAIEAHVKKTGAFRRRAHPLPTLPRWHPRSVAVKVNKPLRPGSLGRAPLVKRRVVSPLHMSVKQVNSSFSVANKMRARSAGPSRVEDRLTCALFAAETMVRREYAGGEPRGNSGTEHFRRTRSNTSVL